MVAGEIRFDEDLDRSSLVITEALDLVAVLTFSRATISEVCAVLGKRHGNRDRTLQLTRNDYRRIIAAPERFGPLGVTVYIPRG